MKTTIITSIRQNGSGHKFQKNKVKAMSKKALLFTGLLALAIACGPAEKKDYQLKAIGLTVNIPGETTIINGEKSEYMLASGQFYIDGEGVEVENMEAESFPSDVKMLETAMTGLPEVNKITEKKTLPNGAFGIVYDKNDNGKVVKDFLFYFKKDDQYFKITPISNEGDKYAECIEAIGTLK